MLPLQAALGGLIHVCNAPLKMNRAKKRSEHLKIPLLTFQAGKRDT